MSRQPVLTMTAVIFQRRAKNIYIRKLILYTRKTKQRLCTNRISLKNWPTNFCNVALPARASLNDIRGTSRKEIVHQWNRSRLPLFCTAGVFFGCAIVSARVTSMLNSKKSRVGPVKGAGEEAEEGEEKKAQTFFFFSPANACPKGFYIFRCEKTKIGVMAIRTYTSNFRPHPPAPPPKKKE